MAAKHNHRLKWAAFAFVVLCLGFPQISLAQDAQSEKHAIERTIHASIGWAKEKDFTLLYSVIANDSNYVEVDPGERTVRGFGQFKKAEKFWGDPDFK